MEQRKIGRIAFREEGTNWNAYYALIDTMEGAIFLGSIARRFVDNQQRKQAFMNLMRLCLNDLFEDKFGTGPVWIDPVPAPEHERTKE